jgi:hypothetical protein
VPLHLRQRLADPPQLGACAPDLASTASPRMPRSSPRPAPPRALRRGPPRLPRSTAPAARTTRTARQRVAGRGVAHGELKPDARHELDGRDLTGPALAGQRQKVEAGLRARHADPGGGARPRQGKQLQDRGGDDAERAFRADEQVLQVVAGVVLAQPPQALPDAPVGEHHFEPEAQIARRAIGDHADAAGVGRKVAADAARAFRRQAQREQPAGRGGRLLHRLERHAGLHRDRVVDGVEIADLVQPVERQHDFVPGRRRRLAADQPGVAGLGDDADAGPRWRWRGGATPPAVEPGRTTRAACP